MRKYKYKVIKRKTRKSAIINGNSKYARKYIKDESTYALGGTLGIMVFSTRRDAKVFISHVAGFYDEDCEVYYNGNPFMIVRVLPIGRGQTVKTIAHDMSTNDLDLFYRENMLYFAPTSHPPHDTMAYPGVFVID